MQALTTARFAMTPAEAVNLIAAQHGKICSVTFIKRTTGELRTLTGRSGVKKGLKGGTLRYNPAEKGLIPFYDMRDGRRMIDANTIKEIKANGKEYVVGERY
jgi:hypothetical protein